jgi:hypothetical protein
MKLKLLGNILILILLSNFILAEETPTKSPEVPSEANSQPKSIPEENMEDKIKNKLKEDNEGYPLPESAERIFRLLFKRESVDLKYAIMLTGLLILILLIAGQALSMGLENKTTGWLIATCIALIGSASGGLNYALELWNKLGETTKLAKEASVFWMSFGIIILVIVGLVLNYLEKYFNSEEIENAKELGRLEGLNEARREIEARAASKK